MRLIRMIVLMILILIISLCAYNILSENKQVDFPEFSSTDSIMVFVAHQDDEAIGATTIMSRAVKSGAEVTVVITTDGSPEEFGYGQSQTDIRNAETKSAMSLIGIPEDHIVFLGYDDLGFIFEIDLEREIEKIMQLIMERMPTHVFVHAYEGGHIDHDATHYMVMTALKRLRKLNPDYKPKIYEFPEYNRFAWGGPIPEDEDMVDNKEYPLITLTLTEEESRLKKDVLKCYRSQHVFKNNTIALRQFGDILKLKFLELVVDGNVLSLNEIKDANKKHFLKLAVVDRDVPASDIPGDILHLTEYGKSMAGRENLPFREKLDFVFSSYDFYTPPLLNVRPGCGSYSTKELTEILEPASMAECKQFLCLGKYYEKDYEMCLEQMGVFSQAIKNQYGGTIPDVIRKNYRIGSYSRYVYIHDPLYGGTIECSPGCRIEMILGTGNFDHRKTLKNVSIEIKQNIGSIKYMTYNYTVGDMSPRSFVFKKFIYRLPPLSPDFREPLELAIIVRGNDEYGNIYKDAIFFTVKIVQRNMRIVYLRPSRKGFYVGFENYWDRPRTCYVEFEVDKLGVRKKGELVLVHPHDIPRSFIHFEPDMYAPGEYEAVVRVYTVVENRSVLTDVLKTNLTIGRDGHFFFSQVSPHQEKRGMMELDSGLSTRVGAYEIRMKDCEEDDYLVCLFFWPDMVREMPAYNYTLPPHERPLLYEYPNEQFNISISFDEFVKVINREKIS